LRRHSAAHGLATLVGAIRLLLPHLQRLHPGLAVVRVRLWPRTAAWLSHARRRPLPAAAATVAAAARGTALLPSSGIAFVHLLAYSTWLGSLVWTTFVAGEP
jgi:hypothetical protein